MTQESVRVCDPDRCHKDGLYDAENDAVRWCEDCKRWYHSGCVPDSCTVEAVVKHTTMPKPHWLAIDLRAEGVALMWARTLALPITRTPFAIGGAPQTFEGLLLKVRRHAQAEGAPSDIKNWLNDAFRLRDRHDREEDCRKTADEFVKLVATPYASRMLKECPRGHWM